MLHYGFYAVQWETHRWEDLVRQLMREERLREQPERMGLLTLVRKLKRKEKLPRAILVLNFDRAMYDAFWLNGGEGNTEQALQVVETIVKGLGRDIRFGRDWLQRHSPVILLVVGSLEHTAEGWWAGYQHPRTKGIQRLFRVEWLVPTPLEPKEVTEERLGCYALL